MKKSHKYLILFTLLVAAAALSLFPMLTESDQTDPYFSYDSRAGDNHYVQVMSGQSIDVPFLFKVEENVTEVVLEISKGWFKQSGIVLTDTTVQVVDGIASSRAIFDINTGRKMKPGTYYLGIVAKESSTGKVLRSGEIPFIVDMDKIIAKCSC